MDNNLLYHTVKKNCAFIVETNAPVNTLASVSEMLVVRKIDVAFLQLQCYDDRGLIIMHCRMEKDRIKYIARLLKEMDGVRKVEFMEDQSRIQQY